MKEIIFKAKEKHTESIERLLEKFEGIINKYARLLDGEDTKQDLSIFLIELIDKMEYESITSYTEKQILSYISKSIRHEYIRLSKRKSNIHINELVYDEDFNGSVDALNTNIEILDCLKDLTNNERLIIDKIFFLEETVNEISNELSITRQAVNQSKKKALSKIKKVLYVK